jgi:hypothetical protein
LLDCSKYRDSAGTWLLSPKSGINPREPHKVPALVTGFAPERVDTYGIVGRNNIVPATPLIKLVLSF